MVRNGSVFVIANAIDVLIDTFFKFPFSFTYILLSAFRTGYDIY